MNHLHRRVIIAGLVTALLVAGAFALLGIGFAAMVAVGLFVLYAILLAGLVVFEEESRLPSWKQPPGADEDHGYHPAR